MLLTTIESPEPIDDGELKDRELVDAEHGVADEKSELDKATTLMVNNGLVVRQLNIEIGALIVRRDEANARFAEYAEIVQSLRLSSYMKTNGGHKANFEELMHVGRTAPISTVWQIGGDIHGFGPKKKAMLIQICPAVGDFWTIIKTADIRKVHVSDLLPDNIGVAVADELTRRVKKQISQEDRKIRQAEQELRKES